MGTSNMGLAVEKITSTLDERLTEKGIIIDVVIYKDWHLRKRAKKMEENTQSEECRSCLRNSNEKRSCPCSPTNNSNAK
jgi:hypothetical protein